MSYRVQTTVDGGYEVQLGEVPPYCHALPMAPPEAEPELLRGLWLVLLVAVWSGPDKDAIQTALSGVERYEGKISLGIRPFDRHEEMTAWCKGAMERYASPVWLLLWNGELVEEHVGLLDDKDVHEMIQRGIAQAG